jgi:hypothetical protein
MQRNNVAISRRCQSDKTQIKDRIGEGWIVIENYSLEGIWKQQPDKREQRRKADRDQQVRRDSRRSDPGCLAGCDVPASPSGAGKAGAGNSRIG